MDSIILDNITYILLEDWAITQRRTLQTAKGWARTGKIQNAQQLFDGSWIVPIDTEEPEPEGPKTGVDSELISEKKQAYALVQATNKFREIFFAARDSYETAIKAKDENPYRARWSKEEIIDLCQWPYTDDWRTLRSRLEREVGLIMLRPGAGRPWQGESTQVWTFATCKEDREWGVINAARSQVGAMRRTAQVTSLAIAPPDEKHAIDSGSKTQIERVLDQQNIKLDEIFKSIQKVKQDLLDRDTMKLLEDYGEL